MWMRFAARGAAAAGAAPTTMRLSSRIAVRRPTARPYPFAGRRRAAQALPFRSMGAGARRCAVLVAGLALLLIAGCGGGGDRAPQRVVAVDTSEPVPWRADGLDRSDAARAIRAAAARRQAALGRLRGVRSVGAALRRARLSGTIGRGTYRRYRAAYDGARAAAARLPGARGIEERAVLGSVETLADALALTPSRFPAVFLNLRRNTRTWTEAPFPAAGERRTFGRSPAVFQYVPGQGMQLHPLATWGRINAGLHRCLDRDGAGCGSRALRRQVDGAARLASERGGFRTWEYLYRYAQGAPPWISGMAQATAVQALARAARAFRAPRYAKLARQALGAFETAPPTGVAVPAAAGGERYVMYSFAPTMQILNGELQAVNGLRTAASLTRSARAERLARAGDTAVRRVVAGFDTGAWSLYSAAGEETTLSYHQLTTGFLAASCRRTGERTYCDAARRFARYEHEPPRIGIGGLHRPVGEARGAAAVLALEGVRGRGAGLRAARAGAGARPRARARRPRAVVHAAVARPLPGARLGARARGQGRLRPRAGGRGAAEAAAAQARLQDDDAAAQAAGAAARRGAAAARSPRGSAASGAGCGGGRRRCRCRCRCAAPRRRARGRARARRRTSPPRAPGRRART